MLLPTCYLFQNYEPSNLALFAFQHCENIWESTNDDVETIGKRYLKGEVTCVSLTFAWFNKLSNSFFFFLSLFVFVACLRGSPSEINFQLRFQALSFIHVKFGQGKHPTLPLQFSFTGHHILPQYTILAIIWELLYGPQWAGIAQSV